MIDPDELDSEPRELWDEMFPGGFWAGAPHCEGPQFRLWSFGAACELLLGRVPQVVKEAVDPNLGPMVKEYMRCQLGRPPVVGSARPLRRGTLAG